MTEEGPQAGAGDDAALERYVLPASFGQERLWFVTALAPGSPAYNMAASVHVDGAVDVGALRAAVADVMGRHEALRTTLAHVDGRVVQLVDPEAPSPEAAVAYTDLRGFAVASRQQAIADLRRAAVAEPFDLVRGPLFRAHLVQVDDESHELLVALHHAIADGLSIGILLSEVASAHAARRAGTEAQLPALPIQYGDFAAWQREAAQAGELDRDLQYWREVLRDAPTTLRLPVLPAAGPAAGAPASSVRVHLPEAVCDGLRAAGRGHQTGLFAVVATLFASIVSRYAGDDDLCLATPVAGRTLPEAESLIGFFVNMVVLRCDLSEGPTFHEAVERIAAVVRGALAHQQAPFEAVVQAVRPQRDVAPAPFVPAGLTIAPATPAFQLDGVPAWLEELPTPGARSDLWLTLADDGATLTGDLLFRTDLFARETVEGMARQLRHLAEAAVVAPDEPLHRLPLIDAAERAAIVAEVTAPGPVVAADATVHQLVEAQVAASPSSPAVECEGVTLTYEVLDRTSNRLAHALRRSGVGERSVVGIGLERSNTLVVALLATLKAGAAYLPLEVDHPEERLTQIIGDADPCVILASSSTQHLFEASGRPVVLIDDLDHVTRGLPDDPPDVVVGGDDLAYVIYTSGSTGRPKGVAATHRGLVNHVLRMQELEPLGSSDRVMQKVPLGFDVSAREIFWTLTAGAVLSMARPRGHLDTAYLIREVKRVGITVMHFVPSMLRLFLEAPDVSTCTSLRLVVCGGEVLTGDLQAAFARRLGAQLVNVYGPTEAAIDVTHHRCDTSATPPPIGRALANCHVHVLDEAGEPVPTGVLGELHIGGVPVARGYLNRPDLTAERFVPDPFTVDPAARLYRTGDIVRRRIDGALEYVGRVDNQVKVRGVRIELEEVETALQTHPDVREAAVVVRARASGSQRLVAYLAPGAGRVVDVAALRAHVRRLLPDYFMPSAFVVVDELPRASNGKLDRRALPDVVPEPEVDDRPLIAPRTTTERLVHDIWVRLLEVDQVSVEDKFFELGGDSLLLLEAWYALDERHPEVLELADLFDHPTIAAIASEIDARSGHAERPTTTYAL